MAGLLETAARNRAALLRRDRAAGADLLRAYALVRRRLQADLDALTARIAQARAAGETVDRAWLAREVRYHRLLAQVEAQVGQFARVAEGRILTEQRLAALAGGEQAGALIRAALPDGGVGVAFNRLPTQALSELVGVLADGSPLSSLLGQLGPQAGRAVRAALIEGVGTGLGPRQIAREVVKATNLSAVRALRIARNETLRAFRSASQETYKANGDILSGWVWWAALSKRTCPVCYAMHGTFHKLDEQFASHVACRCTQLPQTKGSRLAVTRGAEAFKKLPEEDQRAILGPGKFAAYRRGDLALDDLVAKTRDKDWGPGLRERSLRDVSAPPTQAPPARAKAIPAAPRGMGGARTFERDGDAVDWAKRRWAAPKDADTTKEQIEALRQYQSAGYQGVNPHLRGTRAFPAKRVAEMEREVIGPLDTVLAERPVPEDVIAWRGVNRDAFPEMSERLAGKVFEERGYLSTALGAKMPGAFASKDVVMRIRVPAGTPGYFMPNVATDARMRAERELLIGRGQRFIVHEAKYNGRTGKWNLDVELLGPSEKRVR